MTLAAGARLGPYEIQAALGAGGMGEVYRARDTKLGRDVAIKVLPHSLKADAERLARFEREARLLASLNHPHIGAIYGLEDSDGVRGLILELVDGATLADRIARGPLALDETLLLARQIAEALEAAHEKGIIHRDLKPANIKVTPDGNVKVLDFGLAKVREAEGTPDLSTMMGTTPGMILGTVPYMSPEQVNGREADRTSDVWAYGCVLYEMLTGRPAFDGDTAAEILARVLKTEPDWHQLPTETPESIRRLLRRSLQKDQNLRFRDIRDARLEIDDVQSGTLQNERVAAVRFGRRERLAWVAALTLVTLIAAILGARALRPAPTAREVRLEFSTPPTVDPALAISPDGLKVVFTGRSKGQSQLWLRSLASSSARPLPGTEHASLPFWSPDGRSVGFFADARLKRLDIDRGSVKTLVSIAPAPLGGAWNNDGTIVFSSSPGRPILRVSAEGGAPSPVTRFESLQQQSHSAPQFLPDGRHFLFFVTGTPEARGVYLSQLDKPDMKRLFDADSSAVYAATGHLLFVRGGTLLAIGFDPGKLETRGDPFPLSEDLTGRTALSASAAGPIGYRTSSADGGQRQLVWVNRSGAEIEKVVYPDTQSQGPSLSRDGRRVAVFRRVNGNTDIWLYETVRRAWDRITFDSADDIFPLWSPDDHRVAFGSRRGEMDLYWRLLGAPPGRGEDLLLSTSEPKFPMDWSRDGRFLLYDAIHPQRGVDIWALPLEEGRKPREVVQTDFNERQAQFSPDGKWIAYQSDKTGRFEIYLRPFPGPGSDSPVSADGGAQVRWNPNGRELFFIAPDDRLMAVPIRFFSDREPAELGSPRALFATNVGSAAINTNRQQYMVSPDGQSFVMNSVVGEATTSPISVILNWKPRQ
jgi:eukaryotic-like serine/threonine-protein kinase